jgi:adenylate kinase
MNTPYTFIFVGRSGAGKGTQLELLQSYLRAKNTETSVKSIIMGDMYRAFFKSDGFIQDIARDISMKQGKFQPDFLTNALFVNGAIGIIDQESTFFIDGFPRTISQMEVTKSLLEYAKRTNLVVINVELSRASAKQRMLSRGRGDDTPSAADSRLDEYDRTIVPMLEKMKEDQFFSYIEIDGEPDIDTIHKNLINALGI